jgi:hypothetical protein
MGPDHKCIINISEPQRWSVLRQAKPSLLILSVIHHRQNPSESTYIICCLHQLPWIMKSMVHYYLLRGCASRIHNPIITSNTEENTKYRYQETLLNKHFSWKWWQLMTDCCWQIYLLAELVLLAASRGSALIDTMCYHMFLLHRDVIRILYDIVLQ